MAPKKNYRKRRTSSDEEEDDAELENTRCDLAQPFAQLSRNRVRLTTDWAIAARVLRRPWRRRSLGNVLEAWMQKRCCAASRKMKKRSQRRKM